MPTNYIIWDKQNKVVVAGPFPTSANANSFLARTARKIDSRASDKSSKDQSAQLSVETVTV